MVWKTLPGFGIALAIGIAFCLPGGAMPVRERPLGHTVVTVRTEAAPTPEKTPFFTPLAPQNPVNLAVTPVFPASSSAALAGAPAGVPLPDTPAQAALPPPAEDRDATVSEVAAATAWRNNERRRPFSATALASMNDFPTETSAWIPTAAYPELPAKGIETWGRATHYSGKQDQNADASSFSLFKHDGTVYSLGVRQDWSVDSVIGFSVDILDASVKGRYWEDMRKNDVLGYFANAHYQGTFLGQYPVELKATYGRLYHEGDGSFVSDISTRAPVAWHERRHRSHYYNLSGKIGLPLLFAGRFKVLPEVGVAYGRLHTGEYEVELLEDRSQRETMAAVSSRSLTVPLSVSVKRDFKQCWGLVTPRAAVGYTLEFEDSATGLHALNSSSARRPVYDSASGNFSTTPFDASQKNYLNAGVGLDVRTLGGWNLAAEYKRTWSDDYSRSEFRLELGRCF